MTELNLKNISLETITCDKCKRDFSSSLFRKKRRKICKICLWEEVHKDKMKSKKYSFEFLKKKARNPTGFRRWDEWRMR